ncbi:hypothetical protein SSX86_018633 [Deinandra increscens subsp. villosa]|uniref:WRKY domain-containing protein n=1 Tax=Deinandra increscens subsp. villosa TaxID=3103831 RepID=A0AAP0GUY4_9ASTR
MDIKEVGRTIIVKPVASRPTISKFRPFFEHLDGPTHGSPSLEPKITAIRPKTVRLKPVMSPPPAEMVTSQAKFKRTQACHLSDKILKSNHTSPLLYKPLAKTVSRKIVSLLANMGTFNSSYEQSETVKGVTLPKLTPMKSGNNKRPQLYTNNSDQFSYDGYNWRKYGQKQVKGREHPRSYYKCTHPNCTVKKNVERSINGEITEIVYKGDHKHSKPLVPRCHAFDGTNDDLNQQFQNDPLDDDNVVRGSSSQLTNLIKVKESYNQVSSEACDPSIRSLDCFSSAAQVHDESNDSRVSANDVPTSKKRKSLNQLNKTHCKSLEPRVVVHDGTDSEAISDGYMWRKYGQKVVKGNPYPRSYYRCTAVECDVRKHVERARDNPSVFITTYEGKHNHGMLIKKAD